MKLSESEYQEIEARLARNRAKKTSSAQLKSDVAAAASKGQREIREEDVAAKVIEEIEKRGWLVFWSNPTERTGRRKGEPDLEIWADRGRTYHIELKRPVGGKLSTDQLGVIAWGARLGHSVHVVTSLEEFLVVVDGSCEPQHRRD